MEKIEQLFKDAIQEYKKYVLYSEREARFYSEYFENFDDSPNYDFVLVKDEKAREIINHALNFSNCRTELVPIDRIGKEIIITRYTYDDELFYLKDFDTLEKISNDIAEHARDMYEEMVKNATK